MSVPRPKPSLSVAAVMVLLGGCASTTGTVDSSTDAFLRTALDAYGVIEVTPSARTAGTARRPLQPASPPLTASPPPTRRELCANRSGPQPGYLDARTRQPIDCGPAGALSV